MREARELREAQTRPFVVIDLDSSAHTLFDLVVTNIGPTMARNVEFIFQPRAETTDKDLDPYKLKMFRDGISSLAPAKEIRALFDQGPRRINSDLPDTYEVTITYTDQSGKRHYEETVDLDFGLYWGRRTVHVKGVHDLHRELERISTEIRKWTASGSGILAVSPHDIRERYAEYEDE